LVACVVLLAFGCRTTHELGPIGDPGTLAAIEEVTAQADVYAHVEPLAGARDRPPPSAARAGGRVRGLAPDGIVVEPLGEPRAVVPFARVRSVSSYDHARGAWRGALFVGLPVFLLATVFTGFYAYGVSNCSDGCGGPSNPVPLVLGIGALAGLGGAIVGAGLGAVAGYEDRYVVAPQ
jgi:hypothetical protein